MQRIFLLTTIFGFLILTGCKKDNLQLTINAEPKDGNMFLSPSSSNDGEGELLVLDKYGNLLNRKSIPSSAWNFQKWQVGGKTRYTYVEANNSAYHIAPQSIVPGWGVVLDENFKEIERVGFHPLAEAANQTSIDAHDFIYIDDGHYMTISYIEKVVTNIPSSLNPVANCKVVAPVIQEVKNGQVVFQWDGSSYPEFYTQSVEGNKFSDGTVVHDYMHINSIFIDPRDNNIICSIRNANQVIKLNRLTTNIMWRLGGTNSNFAMTSDLKFVRQHNATITSDGHLLLFDNGDKTERAYTRIDEFTLDEEAKMISAFKTVKLPDNLFCQYMGSVQKQNDTYFIGCGSTPKILELNATTGAVVFSMDLKVASYRTFKY